LQPLLIQNTYLLKQNDGIRGEIKTFFEIAKERTGILLVNEDHLVCTVLRNVLIKGVIKFSFMNHHSVVFCFYFSLKALKCLFHKKLDLDLLIMD